MTYRISCCVNNLIRHQYGDKLNELAAEGVEIRLERCQSQCVGCARQPAFMADGTWVGLEPNESFRDTVMGRTTAPER